MTGHVRKRSTWEVLLELGEQPAQRCSACRKRYWLDKGRHESCPKCGGPLEDVTARRQECRPGFKYQKDARKALTKALHDAEHGVYVEAHKVTLAEFLQTEWLPFIESSGKLRPTTVLSYRGHVENHIIPELGTVPLQKLGVPMVNAFYAKLGRSGGRKRVDEQDKGLSPLTRRHIHATLRRALRDAVRWSRVARNVAADAEAPQVDRQASTAMHAWSKEQLGVFLSSVREDRLAGLWRTLATTGMRRGEALGLRWEDLDLEQAQATVRRARVQVGYEVQDSPTKTRKPRVVSLDPVTVTALRAWKVRQGKEHLRWPGWTDNGLVFTREDGEGLHPDRVTKLFDEHQAAIRAEQVKRHEETGGKGDAPQLPRIRLHDLRHTHATLALQAGVHPLVVSKRLGHANISMTLDVYSHVMPEQDESAAVAVAALVDAAQ